MNYKSFLKLVESVGLAPTTNRLTYHYSFHYPFGLWSGLYLNLLCGSLRQVSTPSSFDAWLGISILKRSPNLKRSPLEVSF